MRAALGFKAHSGWAALVAIGVDADTFCLIDRRRIELITDRQTEWAGQPYHAAQGKPKSAADAIVKRGIADARRTALRQMRAAVARLRRAQHEVCACAVLVASPLPDWSTQQILAVHLRMHQAEGALYPEALAGAAERCDLPVVRIRAKALGGQVELRLAMPLPTVMAEVARLGKIAGAPWGADQKQATLAAMIALRDARTRSA